MTEQLRLEQRLGDGGAVDDDERPVGAGPRIVNRARHQLLARARLALDQHRRVEARHAGHQLVDGDDLRRVADEAVGVEALAQLAAVALVVARQPLDLEDAAHGPLDLVEAEGFAEIVVGAAADRLDRRVHRRERREDQHGRRRVESDQPREHREPVGLRHAQIHQRHVEDLALGERDRLAAAAGRTHAIALALEHLHQQVARDRVVVGHQHGGTRGRHECAAW